MFASPASDSPETTATTSGSTSVSMMVSARNARNTPLPATWTTKVAPSPPPPPPPPFGPCGTATRNAIPSRTGIATTTASKPRLRHRRKTSPSSERSSRNHGRTEPRRTPPAATAPPPGAGATSTVDIEALPGELHEQVLQTGPGRVEPGHGNPGQHQLAADRLRRLVPDLGADLAVAGLDV